MILFNLHIGDYSLWKWDETRNEVEWSKRWKNVDENDSSRVRDGGVAAGIFGIEKHIDKE